MNKEWSEKNKKMQSLIGKAATFRKGIDILIELREDLFQQITSIVNTYPPEAFYQMPFAKAEGYHTQTAEEGPQTLTSEFTMPEGPARMLRIMLNAAPEAKGEVGDMKLEVVHPDGSTEPARLKGSRWHNDYMRRWVALHRGEGRPWLAHGRRIKPPRLSCASVESDGRPAPAVFIAAYESLDGRRAYVLANATHEAQDVRCTFSDEREQSLRLAPAELRLEMMPPVSQAVAPSSASRVTRARR